jgi:hypothetical protein
MIGSWFVLQSAWAWEVVAADGTVVASGVAADEGAAGWDCRIALFVARQAPGFDAADLDRVPLPVHFCGRWAARDRVAA